MTALLALLMPATTEGDETKSERLQVIRSGLPRYDPAVHERHAAEQAARDAQVREALAREAAKPATPVAPPPAAARSSDVIDLPTVTVRPTYEPPKPLPRVDAPKPLRDLPGEPLESRSARHERLMKKHLSGFQRALAKIPFLGLGIAGSAHEAESREQRAAQLNSLADGIEIQEALGRDPAEIKRLRAEYQKLYYAGPAK